MAATVDIIAAGRLDFGIGVGGSLLPDPALTDIVRREFGAYGVDLVSAGEAVAALDEACTIVKRMWSEAEEIVEPVLAALPAPSR